MATSQQLLRFPGTIAGMDEAANALRVFLDAQQLGAASRYHVELAFDEIASNIIRHGHPTGDVEVAVAFGDGEIALTFDDDGAPFDPRGLDPVVPPSNQGVPLGGLGLVLVRHITTRLAYERTPHRRNRWTLSIPIK